MIRLYSDYPFIAGGAYLTYLAAQGRPRDRQRYCDPDHALELEDCRAACEKQFAVAGDAAFMAPLMLMTWVADYDAGGDAPPPPAWAIEFCRAAAQLKAGVDYVFI